MTYGTHSNTLQRYRVLIAITASLTVLGIMTQPAQADRRKPAPIVYATPGASATQPQTPRAVTPRQQTQRAAPRKAYEPAAETSRRRVEFRYPDQPDTFYGAGGMRQASEAPPLSFSSSTSAITEADARKYAHTNSADLPRVSAPVKDPAITAGGFDARAAAARVAERQTVEASADLISEPMPPLIEASAPSTLTGQGASSSQSAVFQPVANKVYDEKGKASVFHPALVGQPTANGEIIDNTAMIAAHPSLPLPSLVQVINLQNQKEIVVRVNDRGPFDDAGLIEVSERAASLLGFADTGTANVRVRYLGPAPTLTVAPKPAITPEVPVQSQAQPRLQQVQAKEPVLVPKPSAITTDPFLVQLASFSDIANAQRLHASLNRNGTRVEIVPVRVKGSDFFRVIAGPVDGRRAAETLRDRLANQGVGPGLVIAAP